MCKDADPGTLQQSEVADLQNLIPFRDELATRKGYSLRASITEGSGDTHSILYHRVTKKLYLHRGQELWVSVDAGTNWTNLSSPDPLPDETSRMQQFGDEVLLFTASRIYVTEEFQDIPNIRRFDGGLPQEKVSLGRGAFTADSGLPYIYRYLYTYARYVNVNGVQTLVAESGTMPAGTDGIDYTQITIDRPIDGDFYPWISAPSFPPGSNYEIYTHVHVYRTLNIGPGEDVSGNAGQDFNDPEAYYRCGVFTLSDFTNNQSFGIGSMVIGSTGIDAFTVGPDNNPMAISDVDLLINVAPLLRSRFYIPLAPSLVSGVTPGYIFTGVGSKVTYSETGNPSELAAFHNPAYQFFRLDDATTAIIPTPDSVTVLCTRSTYRCTTFTRTDVGNTTLGLSEFVLEEPTLADSRIGVTQPRSISIVGINRFIALCSDGSVRFWDGRSWGTDMAEGKVREITTKTTESLGVYHDDGYYILWINQGATQKTLRLGLVESQGTGWCFFSGPNWLYPETVWQFVSPVTNQSETIATFGENIYSLMDTWQDNGVDYECSFTTPKIFGRDPSYWCIHQESNFHLRDYVDEAFNPSGYSVTSYTLHGEQTEKFPDLDISRDQTYLRCTLDTSGPYVQLLFSGPRAPFVMAAATVRYRSQDKQVNLSEGYYKSRSSELSTDLISWYSGYAAYNRVDGLSAIPTPAVYPTSTPKLFGYKETFKPLNTTQNLYDFTISIFSKGDSEIIGYIPDVLLPLWNSDIDNWSVYTWVRSGGTLTSYKDGVIVSVDNAFPIIPVDLANMTVGDITVNPIADVRIYSKALSVDSVLYLVEDLKNNQGRNVLPEV